MNKANNERIETIKTNGIIPVSNVHRVISKQNLDFLIEQAERVRELEEEMENYRTGRNVAVATKLKMDDLQQQNKRLREALEFYREENKRLRDLLEQVCQAEDMEDIWDIEDDYRALEGEE